MSEINIKDVKLIDIHNECKARKGFCGSMYSTEHRCKYKSPACDKMKSRTLSGFEGPRHWKMDEQDGGAE
jgi:hypothetical protein